MRVGILAESETSINVFTFHIYLIEISERVFRHANSSTTIKRSKLIGKWKTVETQ